MFFVMADLDDGPVDQREMSQRQWASPFSKGAADREAGTPTFQPIPGKQTFKPRKFK